MKYFFNIFALLVLSTSLFAQRQKTLFVSVQSDCIDEKYCHTIEDLFHENLLDAYIVRTFSDKGEFAKARMKELAFQESGNIPYEDIKSTQKMFAADELMVVVVENLTNGEYYFRAKLFDLETGQLMKTARYPGASSKGGYKAVQEIDDIRTLEKVALELLSKLEINSQQVGNDLENFGRNEELFNKKALAWSLIPGVGLMKKGHIAEGVGYLVGDVALLGAGAGCLVYAKQQDGISKGFDVDFNKRSQAITNRDNANIAAYSLFGAAAVVYAVNLYRAYAAKPKNSARFSCSVAPRTNTFICCSPQMSVDFVLSYNF